MGDKFFGFNVDSQWDYENGFYLTSQPSRLTKLVAHHEFYRMIIGLPGDVIECGVYKGISLIRFATFREIYEHSASRKIIGFDAFGKFPGQADPVDAKFIRDFEQAGGDGISVAELNKVLAYKGFQNIELVPGDIVEKVPQYVASHPELKIALLHIDVDVYKPTDVILKHLFRHVVPGGLIVFDDYGTVHGETAAVDEFLAREKIGVERLAMTKTPVYIRKR